MQKTKSGFTLVEVSLVVGIMCILLAITTLNLSNIAPKTSIDTTVQVLISDIKSQQIKSMSGEISPSGNPDSYGLYFSGSKYVLFHGASYSPIKTDNYDVNLDQAVISSTFPTSSLIFNRNSGEIINYDSSKNTITVTQASNNLTRVITLNKYGAIQ